VSQITLRSLHMLSARTEKGHEIFSQDFQFCGRVLILGPSENEERDAISPSPEDNPSQKRSFSLA